MSTTAPADEIKVSDVHNCCGACCKLMHEVLGKVEGVTEITAKPKERDFTFDAANAKASRQAIAALARAGFHGKTNKEKLVFRDNSGVEKGKVTRLSLVGIHSILSMIIILCVLLSLVALALSMISSGGGLA